MLNLRTVSRYFINALLAAVLLASCGGPAIDQEIKQTSVLQNKSRIVTDVVIKNWRGGYKTIEWQSWITVPKDKVDSAAKAEYKKAENFLNTSGLNSR